MEIEAFILFLLMMFLQGTYAFVEFTSPEAVTAALAMENVSIDNQLLVIKVRSRLLVRCACAVDNQSDARAQSTISQVRVCSQRSVRCACAVDDQSGARAQSTICQMRVRSR